MTSGVATYSTNPTFKAALFSHHERKWRPRELLKFAYPDSPEFAPGSAFDYSDSNYVLLGLVIQQGRASRSAQCCASGSSVP
jgi:D-alanyl-D-alanine carboxypeptidase